MGLNYICMTTAKEEEKHDHDSIRDTRMHTTIILL